MEQNETRSLVVFLLILGFVAGVIGGVGGVTLVANSSTLRKTLNIKENGSAIPTVSESKIENITVREDSAVVDSVRKVSSTVVSVVFTKDVKVIDPFSFGSPYFSQPQGTTQRQQGGGTGFVISSDGLIATNKHVAGIEGADYTVITQDGKKYKASVLAKDSVNDFAILKIDAKNLPVVEFGDSDNLDIGQRVIAIGNALGEFQNSVTVGVLSGKERSLTATGASGSAQESLEGLLQTDAAINEGNSGGPLCNLKGQVIGINTATAAKGQAEGIGFAIPINTLKSAIDSIKKTGKIIRPYLGVRYAMVDQKIAAIKGISADQGALVVGDSTNGIPAIVQDSPADKAGIKEGDVVLKINNEDIGQGKSLTRILSKYQPGDEISVTILRDGKQSDLKVKLAEIPS